MSEVIRLKELKNGQKAVISELAVFDDMRRRLQDIGLIEGTVVECVGRSPLGDPAAYLIRGAVIALRSEDSGQVLVYRMEPEERKYGAGRKRIAEGELVSAASPSSLMLNPVSEPLESASQPQPHSAAATASSFGRQKTDRENPHQEFHETEESVWG